MILHLFLQRGISVIDYILIPYENYTHCEKFKVETVNNIIHCQNLQSLLSSKCKASDHSVLSLEFSYVGVSNDKYRETAKGYYKSRN